MTKRVSYFKALMLDPNIASTFTSKANKKNTIESWILFSISHLQLRFVKLLNNDESATI